MKLKVDYNNGKGKNWDRTAGFLCAIVINICTLTTVQAISFLQGSNSLTAFIDLLPWLVNGLFLLVFTLILPQFALGYLMAVAIFIAVPLLGLQLLSTGRLLIVWLLFLVNMIHTHQRSILSGTGEILGTVSPFIAIGATMLIWVVALYFSKRENEK